jgi:hypothetical protein
MPYAVMVAFWTIVGTIGVVLLCTGAWVWSLLL